MVAFLAPAPPRCLGVGCVRAAVPSLPLHSGHRYGLDHALLAAVVVVSMGSAKVAGVPVRAGATSPAGTSGSATTFVTIARVVARAIGGLVLLDSLDVAITPLLTPWASAARRLPSPCRAH